MWSYPLNRSLRALGENGGLKHKVSILALNCLIHLISVPRFWERYSPSLKECVAATRLLSQNCCDKVFKGQSPLHMFWTNACVHRSVTTEDDKHFVSSVSTCDSLGSTFQSLDIMEKVCSQSLTFPHDVTVTLSRSQCHLWRDHGSPDDFDI